MAKILIVDDEAEARQFLSRSLVDCGYVVREASDGSSALECLEAEHPDVVITDLLMPVMDGFELALRIRANPELAATKVIFFTGRASPLQVQAMAETAGVTKVVTKPATISEVQEAVDAALHTQFPSRFAVDAAPMPDPDQQSDRNPRRAEEQPPANDDRFRIFFERSLDAILLFATDGQCLDANPAAIDLLGYPREVLLKLTFWDLTAPSEMTSQRELWRHFLAAGRTRAQLPLLHGHGSCRSLEMSAVANVETGIHLTLWRTLEGPPR